MWIRGTTASLESISELPPPTRSGARARIKEWNFFFSLKTRRLWEISRHIRAVPNSELIRSCKRNPHFRIANYLNRFITSNSLIRLDEASLRTSVIKLTPSSTTARCSALLTVTRKTRITVSFACASSGYDLRVPEAPQESTLRSSRKSRRRKSCREVTLPGRAGNYDRRKRNNRRGIIKDYFILPLNHLSMRKKRRVISLLLTSTCEKIPSDVTGLITSDWHLEEKLIVGKFMRVMFLLYWFSFLRTCLYSLWILPSVTFYIWLLCLIEYLNLFYAISVNLSETHVKNYLFTWDWGANFYLSLAAFSKTEFVRIH